MTPNEVEQYAIVMKRYGIQNLQVESASGKLVISGLYENVAPLKDDIDEGSTRRALDELEG